MSIIELHNNSKILAQLENKKALVQIKEDGKKIYNTNPNYKEIGDIMDDPKFQNFFDKHFQSFTDLQTILLFMHTYRKIDKDYNTKYGHKLDKHQLTYLLKLIVDYGPVRQKIAKQIVELTKSETIKK